MVLKAYCTTEEKISKPEDIAIKNIQNKFLLKELKQQQQMQH